MDYGEIDFNITDPDYVVPDYGDSDTLGPRIQPLQVAALFFYSLVVLLGVPGNAVVVWVTGFCMPRSVTSLWFLNLALADLLCCLSVPLLMVPLAHDDHWHFGPLACTLSKGLFYLVMHCSILQLVVISVDRWLLVSRPVWCQNHRRPRQGALLCVGVWGLALVVSIPMFLYTQERGAGEEKRECPTSYSPLLTSYRFLVGFFFPFLVIVAAHCVVYRKAESGLSGGSRGRSRRTLRVIVAVVLSFFFCWLPLHTVDFLSLGVPRSSPHSPKLYLAHVLALCLAYFNSCLNPLLYVCLGRGFKDSMNRSLRNILHFISEDPSMKPEEPERSRADNGRTCKLQTEEPKAGSIALALRPKC
ncbi:C5a anaphylatoxin chemotactic receptor 1 [Centropristis striata]|uniref:C5a anaphylatoxin chemotactic receptor 1 n=1 Tax=Centropristis striata TaxID=184440 RepID=UPI0027E19A94|nr:C5a anaphylatoxin chemotactic receptor 1 [Centropristis striata]